MVRSEKGTNILEGNNNNKKKKKNGDDLFEKKRFDVTGEANNEFIWRYFPMDGWMGRGGGGRVVSVLVI